MKYKRGIQLATSTIILLILGLLILIGLVLFFTGTLKNFWNLIKGYEGSEIDNLSKLCQAQCDLGNKYSYCCEKKELGEEKITCLDKRLMVNCEINCEEVC